MSVRLLPQSDFSQQPEKECNLVACRPVGGLHVSRNDRSKSLVIEQNLVSFTPMEYSLLCQLLNDEMVADTILVDALFQVKLVGIVEKDRVILKNLEKHVERTKSKLKPLGLYIRRIHRYGYSLMRKTTLAS